MCLRRSKTAILSAATSFYAVSLHFWNSDRNWLQPELLAMKMRSPTLYEYTRTKKTTHNLCYENLVCKTGTRDFHHKRTAKPGTRSLWATLWLRSADQTSSYQCPCPALHKGQNKMLLPENTKAADERALGNVHSLTTNLHSLPTHLSCQGNDGSVRRLWASHGLASPLGNPLFSHPGMASTWVVVESRIYGYWALTAVSMLC